MNGNLASEAVEFGAVVRESIEAAGGIDVLRRCVADPAARSEAGAVLDRLGLWDVRPLEGPLELEVAAAACRAAGAFAFPYPVVERLVGGGGAVALVAEHGPRVVMHLDLPLGWRGVDLRGRRYRVQPATDRLLGTQLAPFGVEALAEPADGDEPRVAAVAVALHAWWLLGLLETALADTVRYSQERVQFGRPIARFQANGFRLADMTLAVHGLAELGKYTLWSLANEADQASALVDALGLRVAALDAAEIVLRGAHQLHGAMGFTDEVAVSWLSRASQAVRRLPEDRQRSLATLVDLVETVGFAELGRLGSARNNAVRQWVASVTGR